MLLKNRLKSWFQLSGHPDGFAPAGPGTVWKRRTGGAENTERMVYEILSKEEALRDCIPRFVWNSFSFLGDVVEHGAQPFVTPPQILPGG